MHENVATKRAEIEALCRDYGVRRLDVFGSAAAGPFDPAASDVDVLVEFDSTRDTDYVESFFGLKEGLEAVLGRPVDLVSVTSIRNPYFREEILRTRENVYAA
ncbi:nucleotidyltransferase family protein [Cryptosporangium aurantiacum]|uniref:Polymerase nucleotidyl transferase domain-containing protein n=1 Tax=Cryptosporangium aurantiacum TaxID=134849 RepID=A0A1M7Q2F7_9ACTN|nr:nucleotidyltransferase domain-containing protein [Cryptosporangium aurantiacum]SHN24301.1 hypothetical protein SAMN05443668_10453 [Cryptosporangium aurantiacum]